MKGMNDLYKLEELVDYTGFQGRKRFMTVEDALFAVLGKSYAGEEILRNEENRRRILEGIASLRSVLDGVEEIIEEASAGELKRSGGVFVELDYGVIKLTNGNNTICLEPETYIALLRFVEERVEDAIDLGGDFTTCGGLKSEKCNIGNGKPGT